MKAQGNDVVSQHLLGIGSVNEVATEIKVCVEELEAGIFVHRAHTLCGPFIAYARPAKLTT